MPLAPIAGTNTGMEEFLKQLQIGQQNRAKNQELQQTALSNDQLNQYRQAQMGIAKQELGLKQQEAPLNMDLLKARIEGEKALADWRRKGGGGKYSTGTGDELKYHATVADYNPDLSAEQLREASDAYAEGKDELSDGTKLAPINPTIQRALDRAFKSTTTSPLITQGVKANAAEQEMPVIDKAIKEGRSPYGDTVMGISGQQIKDTFDKDNKEAQTRLGNYIASDLLAFDKAALQTRMAGTENGVTIINEIMDKAKQTVKAKYPMLSDEARQVALEKVGKVLSDMIKARNRYGLGATQAVNLRGNNTPGNDEAGDNGAVIVMYKGKDEYHFSPKDYAKHKNGKLKGYTLEPT